MNILKQICMLTAYDYPQAIHAERAKVDQERDGRDEMRQMRNEEL